MSKHFYYGIIEDLETTPRIPIGSFWGVRLLVTPLLWLGPLVFFGLHFALNLLNPALTFGERVTQSLIFTVVVEITTVFHAFGHILSGKLAGSPMDELLMATTRDVNIYHGDQSAIPGRVHLMRSLGGPVFNLIAAGVFWLIAPGVGPGLASAVIASLISTNAFFGLGGLLPIPSVDGFVIWRELLGPLARRLRGDAARDGS